MASPRRPIRVLDKSNISEAYPMEIVADPSSGDLSLVNNNNQEVKLNELSIEQSGNGEVVSDVQVSGRKVTIVKSNASHPSIATNTDSSSNQSATYGSAVTMVDSVTRDSNGHVTKVNTKTVTMPTLSGVATTALYQATIGTTWTGSAAPYTQTISVSGIKSSDTPIVDVNLANVAYSNKDKVIEAYSSIYRITTNNNSITVYSDEKTTTSVPIQLKVVR